MSVIPSRSHVSEYNGDESVPVFVTFVIEQYKHRKGISGDEAMRRLSAAGVLEYLAEFYDVLHQQSADWLLEEVEKMINHISDHPKNISAI